MPQLSNRSSSGTHAVCRSLQSIYDGAPVERPEFQMDAVCSLPRELLLCAAQQARQCDCWQQLEEDARDSVVDAQSHEDGLQAKQANEVAELADIYCNNSGKKWHPAMARARLGDCLLDCLDLPCRALARPELRGKAADASGAICSVAARLLRAALPATTAQQPAATLMNVKDWQRRTADLPAWLRQHVPESLAVQCCNIFDKVCV